MLAGLVIMIVGCAASLSLFAAAWWLWRSAGRSALTQATEVTQAVSRGVAPAPVVEASPDAASADDEQTTAIAQLPDASLEKAKTTFFRKDDSEKTQILLDDAGSEPGARDPDAPVPLLEQIQTAPKPRAKPAAAAPPNVSAARWQPSSRPAPSDRPPPAPPMSARPQAASPPVAKPPPRKATQIAGPPRVPARPRRPGIRKPPPGKPPLPPAKPLPPAAPGATKPAPPPPPPTRTRKR